MSGRDQGDDKGFLARWSQRKREAEQPEPKPAVAADDAAAASAPVAEGDAAQEVEFDLSSLPKLEELTGTTDITAFLRKGVPEHLRNEALRKSWALDPAIRNYVNPALEYEHPGRGAGDRRTRRGLRRRADGVADHGRRTFRPSNDSRQPGNCASERSRAISRT
jgi:hypothetical protein